MVRRLIISAVAAAIGCLVADVAAAFLYVVIVFEERVSRDTAFLAVFVGVELWIRSLPLAIPAAVLFNFLPERTPRPVAIGGAALVAATLACGLSYWSFDPMFHISPAYAAVLLSLTWASTALILATAQRVRSPN